MYEIDDWHLSFREIIASLLPAITCVAFALFVTCAAVGVVIHRNHERDEMRARIIAQDARIEALQASVTELRKYTCTHAEWLKTAGRGLWECPRCGEYLCEHAVANVNRRAVERNRGLTPACRQYYPTNPPSACCADREFEDGASYTIHY